MTPFGERIKQIRLDLNMSIGEAADELGISRGHLANLESGSRAPTKDALLSIAELYGEDFGELRNMAWPDNFFRAFEERT